MDEHQKLGIARGEFPARSAARPSPVTQPTMPAPPPHPLDKQWFTYIDGTSSGPFSGHHIRKMRIDGALDATDFVCPVGGTAWIQAKDDPILGRLFAPRPPAAGPQGPAAGKGSTVVQVTNNIAQPSAPIDDGPAAPKSPGVAVLLSFLLCGVGQMYNGQVAKGFLFLIGCVLLWIIFLGWVIWIWSMVDAYTTAKAMSLRYQRRMLAGVAVSG